MSKFLEELLEEGREEGREENLIDNIKSLMNRLHLTVAQAMDALDVPAEKQSYYQGLI